MLLVPKTWNALRDAKGNQEEQQEDEGLTYLSVAKLWELVLENLLDLRQIRLRIIMLMANPRKPGTPKDTWPN